MGTAFASAGGGKPNPPAGQGAAQQYEALIQAAIDYAIFRLELDGTVASWNPGAERIKGYTANEIFGRHFRDFFLPADREAGRPERALAIAGETGRFADEGWRLRKDGTRFRAFAVIDAIRDGDGTVIGFVKITQDITERWKVQSALEESERLFRLLVEGVSDHAIYMLDPGGRISNWNTGAERIKGYRADEVIGRHFSMFFTAEDAEEELPRRVLAEAAATGRYGNEGWRRRKDGSRFWAGVVLDAIRGEGGELIGFAKVTRDLSRQREAAARLAEMREQLAQAQKREALGQLTGGVAHDFNNLLTAILGATRMAGRHAADTERLAYYLDQIKSACERGAGAVRQLMDFARREPVQLEVMDVGRQIRQVEPLIRQSLNGDVMLVVEMGPDLQPVMADTTGFGLALLNLALNGRDAISGAGIIRISAEGGPPSIDAAGQSRDTVMVSVSDTGAGIPAELQARVLEPFFTTKVPGKGAGLGLNQVRNFVEAAGGSLEIVSWAGEGTSVSMRLPVSAAAPVDPAAMPRPRTERPRVLIVEDDPVIAELGAEFFAEMNHEPHVVHNADAALAALEQGPAFDLLFSDVVMPGAMSGLDLARKVRATMPHLPILLTTGFSHVIEGRSEEFPLIRKPYDFDALAGRVGGLLAE